MNNAVCFVCRQELRLCNCNQMSQFFNRIRASIGIYVTTTNNLTYPERVARMTRNELFSEMDIFAGKRRSGSSLNMSAVRDGIVLFNRLAEVAELPQVRQLFDKYAKHLESVFIGMSGNEDNVVNLLEYLEKKKEEKV